MTDISNRINIMDLMDEAVSLARSSALSRQLIRPYHDTIVLQKITSRDAIDLCPDCGGPAYQKRCMEPGRHE